MTSFKTEYAITTHTPCLVVPMPLKIDDAQNAWNMTQSVQQPQMLAIVREASQVKSLPDASGLVKQNFRDELRSRRTFLSRWPLFLRITLPEDAPPAWKGIFASRLMPTLIPQLEVCGFYPRPLCVDDPAFVILLWPKTGHGRCRYTSMPIIRNSLQFRVFM